VQITETINRENQGNGNGNGNRTGVRPGRAPGTEDQRASISEAVGGRWPSIDSACGFQFFFELFLLNVVMAVLNDRGWKRWFPALFEGGASFTRNALSRQ